MSTKLISSKTSKIVVPPSKKDPRKWRETDKMLAAWPDCNQHIYFNTAHTCLFKGTVHVIKVTLCPSICTQISTRKIWLSPSSMIRKRLKFIRKGWDRTKLWIGHDTLWLRVILNYVHTSYVVKFLVLTIWFFCELNFFLNIRLNKIQFISPLKVKFIFF